MNIGARRPPPRKIIMNVSVNDDIQLKKSENAWKPGLKREGPAEDTEMQKTQAGTKIHACSKDKQKKKATWVFGLIQKNLQRAWLTDGYGDWVPVLIDSPQELFRKVRSILNKLTPQKFNQLMKQVTDLTIDTEERLKGVIDLVFEKAIDEPSFSVAYGNMCRCLATVSQPLCWSKWIKWEDFRTEM